MGLFQKFKDLFASKKQREEELKEEIEKSENLTETEKEQLYPSQAFFRI